MLTFRSRIYALRVSLWVERQHVKCLAVSLPIIKYICILITLKPSIFPVEFDRQIWLL